MSIPREKTRNPSPDLILGWRRSQRVIKMFAIKLWYWDKHFWVAVFRMKLQSSVINRRSTFCSFLASSFISRTYPWIPLVQLNSPLVCPNGAGLSSLSATLLCGSCVSSIYPQWCQLTLSFIFVSFTYSFCFLRYFFHRLICWTNPVLCVLNMPLTPPILTLNKNVGSHSLNVSLQVTAGLAGVSFVLHINTIPSLALHSP